MCNVFLVGMYSLRLSLVLFVGLLGSAMAQEVALGKLFLGTVDTFRDNQDSQYGFEYQFAEGKTQWDFKPFVGLLRTRGASHYAYAGFSRTSKFTSAPTGLAMTFSFGPGIYLHGGGEDTDLGHWFELRTSAGLLWLFDDQTRVGLHFSHLSNASIADTNPGTELISLTYELPF
jgi:hypothetical protein